MPFHDEVTVDFSNAYICFLVSLDFELKPGVSNVFGKCLIRENDGGVGKEIDLAPNMVLRFTCPRQRAPQATVPVCWSTSLEPGMPGMTVTGIAMGVLSTKKFPNLPID